MTSAHLFDGAVPSWADPPRHKHTPQKKHRLLAVLCACCIYTGRCLAFRLAVAIANAGRPIGATAGADGFAGCAGCAAATGDRRAVPSRAAARFVTLLAALKRLLLLHVHTHTHACLKQVSMYCTRMHTCHCTLARDGACLMFSAGCGFSLLTFPLGHSAAKGFDAF